MSVRGAGNLRIIDIDILEQNWLPSRTKWQMAEEISYSVVGTRIF